MYILIQNTCQVDLIRCHQKGTIDWMWILRSFKSDGHPSTYLWNYIYIMMRCTLYAFCGIVDLCEQLALLSQVFITFNKWSLFPFAKYLLRFRVVSFFSKKCWANSRRSAIKPASRMAVSSVGNSSKETGILSTQQILNQNKVNPGTHISFNLINN